MSIAVVEVDTQVTNASSTQKSMFTMCNAALNACWYTAATRRHLTGQ